VVSPPIEDDASVATNVTIVTVMAMVFRHQRQGPECHRVNDR
jgi:hypothetical protein